MGNNKHNDDREAKKQKTCNASSSSKSGKSMMMKPCSGSKANLKKRKEKSEKRDHEDEQIVSKTEFNEMKKSIKDLSEVVKKLQEILPTKANLLEESKETTKTKEEETPKKKEIPKYPCSDCKVYPGECSETICVKGFDNLRPRDEIMKDLRNIFGSCGEFARVFVPNECEKLLPLGLAFINLNLGLGNDKALALSGSYMGGKELEVSLATDNDEFYGYANFYGCDRCPTRCFRKGEDTPYCGDRILCLKMPRSTIRR
ncbi:unnamed protein product [Arabis nemorensis]|uniref:RRM domain-containing protein n=1 Tax=Arabis nemorensis TaxID=586526 RepID=A0A565B1Y0_9BRAS|nr:unnamed protein product [Arabis nemorensis]